MNNIIKKLILACVSLGIVLPAFPGNDEGKQFALVLTTGAGRAVAQAPVAPVVVAPVVAPVVVAPIVAVATGANTRRNALGGALLAVASVGAFAVWRWYNASTQDDGTEWRWSNASTQDDGTDTSGSYTDDGTDTSGSDIDDGVTSGDEREFVDPVGTLDNEPTVEAQEAFEALEDAAAKAIVTEVNVVIRAGNTLTQEEKYVLQIGNLYNTFLGELNAKSDEALTTQSTYLLGKLDELLQAYKQFRDTHTSSTAMRNRELQMRQMKELIKLFTGNADAIANARSIAHVQNTEREVIRIELSAEKKDFVSASIGAYRDMVISNI